MIGGAQPMTQPAQGQQAQTQGADQALQEEAIRRVSTLAG